MESPKTAVWPKIRQVKKVKPLGTTTPYAWALEPVHGCNLKCGHCSARLLPAGKFDFMSRDTWRAVFTVMNSVTPTCRVDLAFSGEPTLHPQLLDFLRDSKELCPRRQLQVTTNGTMLLKGKVTFAQLFKAGANIVYVDTYGPRERFVELAKASGIPWYEYYDAPEGVPSPWTYYGPHLKIIVLQEPPERWPASRFRAGLLGTWYNNLDWEAAKRFNLSPVVTPPGRRCNQPFIYVPVNWAGSYLLCCQDNMGETAGQYGSVHDGVNGFCGYWYSRKLQWVRRQLREKNRAGISQCRRCDITFSRCDYRLWSDEEVNHWWDGTGWQLCGADDNFDR